ncbi:MAG: hypothetical protein V7638_277 [Acidobacteriota bacterium]|jgi:hypothetical protein
MMEIRIENADVRNAFDWQIVAFGGSADALRQLAREGTKTVPAAKSGAFPILEFVVPVLICEAGMQGNRYSIGKGAAYVIEVSRCRLCSRR